MTTAVQRTQAFVYSFRIQFDSVIRLSCSSLGDINFIATSKSTARNINERWKLAIFQEAKTLSVYTPTAQILLFGNQLWHFLVRVFFVNFEDLVITCSCGRPLLSLTSSCLLTLLLFKVRANPKNFNLGLCAV